MKYNVLYVDDEEINLRVFESVFKRSYNILTTLSGEGGLKILENMKIHLIITDQRMPHMTGVEFLKKVYKKFPYIPPSRIMLSGYSESKAINEAKDKYCLNKFINKPWEINDLKLQMDNAIANALSS